MPKFMLIVGGADMDKRKGNPTFAPLMFDKYTSWIRSLKDSGRYVASNKLRDQTGRRLTVRGGEIVDGPFIESKDAVGGVFMVIADSLHEATSMARECPILLLQRGYVEVRLVEETGVPTT